MSSFFSTPSPVEKKVEAATSESHPEPPLESLLEIAEDISKSPDASVAQPHPHPPFPSHSVPSPLIPSSSLRLSSGAGHLKAIRKRLASKSAHVQYLSLCLLDVAVKNGGDAFHETVSAPEFLSSLSALATSTKFPHVRDQALSLLQTWGRSMPQQGLHSFAEAYTRLRNKGVAFPDDKAGGVVFTPPVNLTVVAQRNVSVGRPDRSPGRSPNKSPGRSPGRSPREEKEPSERHPLSWASPAYVEKVRGECVQVFEYLSLFRELIASTAPAAAIRANESIQSLHSTVLDCRARVSHLLVELDEETLMDLMIHVSEAIRLTLDYYAAKLRGQEVPPPTIDLPALLRPTTAAAAGVKAEAKEGKEEARRERGAKTEADDPFAAIATRPERKQASPAAATSAPISASAVTSAGGVSLSQFDPLA